MLVLGGKFWKLVRIHDMSNTYCSPKAVAVVKVS